MGNQQCCGCCCPKEQDLAKKAIEIGEDGEPLMKEEEDGTSEDAGHFRANLARSMLPASTTVLSANQNYNLSTLNNQVNSGIVQQIMGGVIVVLSFEEGWTQTGNSSSKVKHTKQKIAISKGDVVVTSLAAPNDEEEEIEEASFSGVYDNLIAQPVTVVTENVNQQRLMQFEQKEEFHEVDIDFVSRADLFTNFGLHIYSVSSPAYFEIDRLMNAERKKRKKKAKEDDSIETKAQLLTTTTEESPAITEDGVQLAAPVGAEPGVGFATASVSSLLTGVKPNEKKEKEKEKAAKNQVKSISTTAVKIDAIDRGGLRFDLKRKATSLVTESKETQQPEKRPVTLDDDDSAAFFSKSGRYEKIELDFNMLRKAYVSYVLFQVKFPFSQAQLKTSVHYSKLRKKGTGGATTRKTVQKKIPRSLRFMVRVYDKLTKVELCRYVTQLDSQQLYSGINSENDELVGVLYYNQEDQKWLFRASNFFRPVPPTRLMINVLEGQELPAVDQDGKADPFCVIEYPAGNVIYKTKTKKKTVDPVWNEVCEFKFSSLPYFNANDKLIIKVLDYDALGKHETLGTLSFNLLDLFTYENSTFHKEKKEAETTQQFTPVLNHDTEWFYLESEGRLKLNFSLNWD